MDEAASFLAYLGLTEAKNNFIKKFTEERDFGFLTTYANVKEERKKCVADDLKCSNTDTSSEQQPSIAAGSRCRVKYGPSRIEYVLRKIEW